MAKEGEIRCKWEKLEKYCLQFLEFCIIINNEHFLRVRALASVLTREVTVKNMNLLVWLG